MFRIKLPVKLDGERYGIRFQDGVGECDNSSVASRLKEKGFEVTEITSKKAGVQNNKAAGK